LLPSRSAQKPAPLTPVKQFLRNAAAAYAVMAGIVVSRFADEAMPTTYLFRPLLLLIVPALIVGIIALVARRHGPLLAVGLGAFALHLLIGVAVIGIGVLLIGLRAIGRPIDVGRMAIIVALLFLAVALVRAVPLVEIPGSGPAVAAQTGPPIYVVLLDGYPRLDSLAEIEIDNTSFVDALEQRGFTYYQDATSETVWTEQTLTAVLTGHEVGPFEEASPVGLKRELRAQWDLPNGFIAIDSQMGHVSIPGVPHIGSEAVNDFEANLIMGSGVGRLASEPIRRWLAEDLLAHHHRTLDILASAEHRRVFAHLIAPHPPFVFGDDETTACWPVCHLWAGQIERTGMSLDDWIGAFDKQLAGLNPLLLDTVDSIIEREPDAVIVLFSDHGARYTEAMVDSEWHRIFLAARTPGHDDLFADGPHPRFILTRLLEAYAE
jgi:hypothetical protein